MKQLTNLYENTCSNCHHYGRINTLNENNTELSVCYHCGELIQKQAFDSRAYIKELMEEGIDHENDIVNVLIDKLDEVYNWMDDFDLEALAGLLVKNLYDEVKFEVEAEAEETAEYIREREVARMGAY